MAIDRRELLAGIGASTLAWAFGCGRPAPTTPRPTEVSGEVRAWLRDAVARLAGTYAYAQAIAVSRRRTTCAIDVAGTGVARQQLDGVLLRVREPDGTFRELVGSVLTREAVSALVVELAGPSRKTGSVNFGTPQRAMPTLAVDPRRLTDKDLHDRVQQISDRDRALTSRIVYAATSLDLDDTTMWSVDRDGDREQRLVRVRQAAMRVAWNGSRPLVTEATTGWTGSVDDRTLDEAALHDATTAALELMTPGAVDDGVYAVALDPSIVAMVMDASVRGVLTTTAARRPDVASRLTQGATIAAPLVTLADDPTVPASYGGFAFDDAGQPATRQVLVDGGHVMGLLDRPLRAGHLGPLDSMPSHLQMSVGATAPDELVKDGLALERGLAAMIDPSSDRVVVSVSRAREWRGGRRTGRVFADVELVGNLTSLLGSVSAVASEAKTFALRDDDADGNGSQLPRWRSIEVPALALRGAVRARPRG